MSKIWSKEPILTWKRILKWANMIVDEFKAQDVDLSNELLLCWMQQKDLKLTSSLPNQPKKRKSITKEWWLMNKTVQIQGLRKKKILRNFEIMSNKQSLKSKKTTLLSEIGMMIWPILTNLCSKMRKMNQRKKMLRMKRNESWKNWKDENERKKSVSWKNLRISNEFKENKKRRKRGSFKRNLKGRMKKDADESKWRTNRIESKSKELIKKFEGRKSLKLNESKRNLSKRSLRKRNS